jgi:hypothetical protein
MVQISSKFETFQNLVMFLFYEGSSIFLTLLLRFSHVFVNSFSASFQTAVAIRLTTKLSDPSYESSSSYSSASSLLWYGYRKATPSLLCRLTGKLGKYLKIP